MAGREVGGPGKPIPDRCPAWELEAPAAIELDLNPAREGHDGGLLGLAPDSHLFVPLHRVRAEGEIAPLSVRRRHRNGPGDAGPQSELIG